MAWFEKQKGLKKQKGWESIKKLGRIEKFSNNIFKSFFKIFNNPDFFLESKSDET